jgi:predicted TIM-barrel fold metal-dependent hydrolase
VPVETLEHARGIVDSFEAHVRSDLPAGVTLFDAHTHLGEDIDGTHGRPDELLGMLDRYGFGGAFMFCLDEPDREPAFRAANDRTLAFAEASEGRLVPFVRLDLEFEPVVEAERCLDLGARGIKLHPRAQRFTLGDERLAPVFALATERSVPILIHGGRGLPPIADELARLVETSDGVRLIIAHAGIADMARLADYFGGVEGVYFDTSVWSAVDLLDLLRQVSPEQLVFATDYPYGQNPNMLLLTLRAARLAGLDEAQVRGVLGDTASAIARGDRPAPLTAPRGGSALAQPLTFARIHQYVSMATPMLWLRQPDAVGALGLAVNAALEENGHAAEADAIRDALVTARDLWLEALDVPDLETRRAATSTAKWLVHMADILAVTTRA